MKLSTIVLTIIFYVNFTTALEGQYGFKTKTIGWYFFIFLHGCLFIFLPHTRPFLQFNLGPELAYYGLPVVLRFLLIVVCLVVPDVYIIFIPLLILMLWFVIVYFVEWKCQKQRKLCGPIKKASLLHFWAYLSQKPIDLCVILNLFF